MAEQLQQRRRSGAGAAARLCTGATTLPVRPARISR